MKNKPSFVFNLRKLALPIILQNLLSEAPVCAMLHLTSKASVYLKVMYRLLSLNVLFAAITNTMLSGIFPAGGDTKYGLCIDGMVMWGFCVFLGFLAAFVFRLNPLTVFVILNIDELIKTPFVILRYRKNKWLNNFTH